MKEKKKYEELKSILDSMQKLLKLYNDLNPEEKLVITPQDERKDVSNIFVCVYNAKHVGLFEKINWSTKISKAYPHSEPEYDAGSIYVGIDSNYIGMKKTHYRNINRNNWELIGTKVVAVGKEYIANCQMQNGMSFDDMRLIMYNNGQIGPYEIGKASSEEMIDVLKYASSYYKLNQKIKSQRTK